MRRLLLLLAIVVLPVFASACTGQENQAAQLLEQAQTAAKSVSSEAFVMSFSGQASGASVTFHAQGGAVLQGTNAGDAYVTMTGALPAGQSLALSMVKRGDLIVFQENGVTRTITAPPSTSSAAASGFDVNALASVVKDVSVSSVDVDGRTEDEISGTLDGNALLSSMPGLGNGVLAGSGVSIGDIHVKLFIPRDTHLIQTALLDMSMKAGGKTVQMNLSFAVTSVNQPLTFPK